MKKVLKYESDLFKSRLPVIALFTFMILAFVFGMSCLNFAYRFQYQADILTPDKVKEIQDGYREYIAAHQEATEEFYQSRKELYEFLLSQGKVIDNVLFYEALLTCQKHLPNTGYCFMFLEYSLIAMIVIGAVLPFYFFLSQIIRGQMKNVLGCDASRKDIFWGKYLIMISLIAVLTLLVFAISVLFCPDYLNFPVLQHTHRGYRMLKVIDFILCRVLNIFISSLTVCNFFLFAGLISSRTKQVMRVVMIVILIMALPNLISVFDLSGYRIEFSGVYMYICLLVPLTGLFHLGGQGPFTSVFLEEGVYFLLDLLFLYSAYRNFTFISRKHPETADAVL